MPADIEMKTFVARRARNAADVNRIGLEHGDVDFVLRQEIAGRQTRRARSDDRDRGFHRVDQATQFPCVKFQT